MCGGAEDTNARAMNHGIKRAYEDRNEEADSSINKRYEMQKKGQVT